MKAKDDRGLIASLFIPRYNELALCLMSLAFLLVFFSHADLRTDILELHNRKFDPRWYVASCVFMLGIFYSLYHVFTLRQKTELEKFAMLFFAVIVNAFSGIAAGIYMLNTSQELLLAFPVWNIVNGVLLLIMLRAKIIDERCILDDNATPPQVVLGSSVVLATFAICHFVLELYWAVTFSFCVTYAGNVNGKLQSLVLKQRIINL